MTRCTRAGAAGVALLLLLSVAPAAWAGAPDGWTAGVEGQSGWGPAAWSPDGRWLAATRWDRATLTLVEVDTGETRLLSRERGAGFHRVWIDGGSEDGTVLLCKEVVAGDDGGAVHRIVRIEPHSGERTVLDEGRRLGDPAVSGTGAATAGAVVAWTRGTTLVVFVVEGDGALVERTKHALPGYSNLIALDPAGTQVAFHHDDGSLGVLALDSGVLTWLSGPGAYSHPAWSADGAWLLFRTPRGAFAIADPIDGTWLFEVAGTHPRWTPDGRAVLFERVELGAGPYVVAAADLWRLNVATGAVVRLAITADLHERYPAPSPDGGALAFADTATGALHVVGVDATGGPGETRLILSAAAAPDAPPPPPAAPVDPGHPDSRLVIIDVPYMHQLWDTPDDFDGGWSCGPTSCVQTVQKYSALPDHDITCSWPTSHTSPWGWYVPNEYTFNGYTYDVPGLAAGDVWVEGAHGFICRELGAAYWAYMVDFCNQHDIDSWQAGTSWGTLTAEIDAGYPMYASTSVLSYGHILVIRGYDSDHTIVVNDPYGDAGTGNWGNFDGESALYDWPGYNNGHLTDFSIAQLFGAQGPLLPDYDARYVAQHAPETMEAGETVEAWVEYVNDGSQTWAPGATFLGTTEPQDRASPFEDAASWTGANRPATVDATTAPDELGRFTFLLHAPAVDEPTEYVEHWGLVQEPTTWFGPPQDEVSFTIEVIPASGDDDATGDDDDTGAADDDGSPGKYDDELPEGNGCSCGRTVPHSASPDLGLAVPLLLWGWRRAKNVGGIRTS